MENSPRGREGGADRTLTLRRTEGANRSDHPDTHAAPGIQLAGRRIGGGVDRAGFGFRVVSMTCVEKAVKFGLDGEAQFRVSTDRTKFNKTQHGQCALAARAVMNFGKKYIGPFLRPPLDPSHFVHEVSILHDAIWYDGKRSLRSGNNPFDDLGRIFRVCFLNINLGGPSLVTVDVPDRFLQGSEHGLV